jgi:biotin transport system substrate-specific component
MTSLTTSLRQAKPSTIGWTFGFAVAMAAAAQVSMPIPGTPVPFSLTPLVVVLAGLMLGPIAGAASMFIYLAAGATGLPVFSPIGAPGIARFFGPTGGYLFAYPAAAWVTGFLAGTQPTFARRFLAACAGIVTIFAGGIAQLTVLTGSYRQAVDLGVTTFFPLDVVKALIAAGISGTRKPPSR